jgi:hypothetical protein
MRGRALALAAAWLTTAELAAVTGLRLSDRGPDGGVSQRGQLDRADRDRWSQDQCPVRELLHDVSVVVVAPHPRQACPAALVNDKFASHPSIHPLVAFSSVDDTWFFDNKVTWLLGGSAIWFYGSLPW